MERNSSGSLVLVAAAFLAVTGVAACSGGSSNAGGTVINTPNQSVRVVAEDTYRYSPSVLSVKEGTRILFKVTNDGHQEHEFIVGDSALQAAHEAQMQAMFVAMKGAGGAMSMPDDAHGVELAPGQTKTVTWIADNPGTFQFGCHQPGHYAAGMMGTIKVTA